MSNDSTDSTTRRTVLSGLTSLAALGLLGSSTGSADSSRPADPDTYRFDFGVGPASVEITSEFDPDDEVQRYDLHAEINAEVVLDEDAV
jgi:hypothetical protein